MDNESKYIIVLALIISALSILSIIGASIKHFSLNKSEWSCVKSEIIKNEPICTTYVRNNHE
jgi:hypothetical protein